VSQREDAGAVRLYPETHDVTVGVFVASPFSIF
jgi:hypothetical protein